MTNKLTTLFLCFTPLLASAQTWRVDQQIRKDFPDQSKEVVRSYEVNGIRIFHLKITGNRGESTVQITEGGDYLSKAVPTRLGGMPDNVMTVLKSLFTSPPSEAKHYESTTYTVDVATHRPVRIEIDAAGRIRDIVSGAQLRAELRKDYPPVTRHQAHHVADKIETYFENARIKQIYSFPDTPGFYYAELTADRGSRQIEVVMDTRKDVPYWRFEIRAHELPKPVARALNDLLPGAKVERLMRVKQTWYEVEQPAGEDTLQVDIRPTGDVVRVRGLLNSDGDGRWNDRDRGHDHDKGRPPVRGRRDWDNR